MFITAADIGKFLSEMVTKSYRSFVQLKRWLRGIGNRMKAFCCRFIQRAFLSIQLSLFRCCGKAQKAEESSKLNGDVVAPDKNDDVLDEWNLPSEDESVELPIFAYFGMIIGYCAIGSALFNTWEKGPIWYDIERTFLSRSTHSFRSFIHGFFFSFNTITTIGLGNILVRQLLYLVLIVIYVIVGLAVITMCVDLASSQLKVAYIYVHSSHKFALRCSLLNCTTSVASSRAHAAPL